MQWQELYATCVSEAETDRLEKLTYDTEGAMYLRLRELAHELRPSNEAQELKQAATGLLEIRIRKLGWPDPLTAFKEHQHAVPVAEALKNASSAEIG